MTLQEMLVADALEHVEKAGMKHTAATLRCLLRWLENRP